MTDRRAVPKWVLFAALAGGVALLVIVALRACDATPPSATPERADASAAVVGQAAPAPSGDVDASAAAKEGTVDLAFADEAAVRTLLDDASKAGRVKRLVVTNCPEGAAVVRRIAAATTLGSLDALILESSNLGDEEAEALARSAALARIRELSLASNDIGPRGARALAQPAVFPALRALDLSHNPLGAAGARALAARLEGASRLERLHLDYTFAGPEGAEALAERPGLAVLSELTLSYAFLGDVGAKALARSAFLTGLHGLGLDSEGITDAGASAFIGSTLPPMAALELTRNPIDPGAEAKVRAAFAKASFQREPSFDDGGLTYWSDDSTPSPLGPSPEASVATPPEGLPQRVEYFRFMNPRFGFAVDLPTFLLPEPPPANGDGRTYVWGHDVEVRAWGMNEMVDEDDPDSKRRAAELARHDRKHPLISIGAAGADAFFDSQGVHVAFAFPKAHADYFGPIARHVARSLRVLPADVGP